MINKNKLLIIRFLPLCIFVLAIKNPLAAISEGELLFTQNRTREALPLLEADIAAGRASGDAYNYLGLAYFQLGEYKKSVEAFDNALKSPLTNKAVIYYNKGNSHYALKDYAAASKSFTLAIEADKKNSKAFLNRANTYLQMKRYIEAISDYTNFLKLDPKNPQRTKIIKLIGLLKEEQKRLDAEAAAQKKLTEEYSDNPDFYENMALDELFYDDPYFYSATGDDSELYRDEYFGADKKTGREEEALSAEQQKMLMEDAAILEEGRIAEEARKERLKIEGGIKNSEKSAEDNSSEGEKIIEERAEPVSE